MFKHEYDQHQMAQPCPDANNDVFFPPSVMSQYDSMMSTDYCSNDDALVSTTSSADDVYCAFGEFIGQSLRRLNNDRRAETIQRKMLMVMYDEIERTENSIPFQFQNHSF